MLFVVLFFFAMITLLVCVRRWRCMYRGTGWGVNCWSHWEIL